MNDDTEFEMNDKSNFEICYDILDEIQQILIGYHKELPPEEQKILVELSDRINNHFYGDVE